jgi:HPt (histidine-containing phosphotransfer) domain-containing protein/two-component sensor histidine kinase
MWEENNQLVDRTLSGHSMTDSNHTKKSTGTEAGGAVSVASKAKPGRVFLPLSAKLIVPIVLLTAVVAFGSYEGLMRTSRANLLESKLAAGQMVVRLFSASVTPAVVFGDETEMGRSVGDLSRNPEVVDVELWPAATPDVPAPDKPLAQFHRNSGAVGKLPRFSAQRAFSDSHMELIEPIVDNDKKVIAAARVRFSLAREQAVLRALGKRTLYVSAGVGLSLSVILILMLARVVVVPLGRLKRAALSLQEGRRETGAVTRDGSTEDEVDQLGRVFVSMADAVADREHRLAQRNGEMRLILDNVAQGFLTVTLDGVVQAERSAIVERWLGPIPTGTTVGELMALLDPKLRAFAELGWSQLSADFLPIEVSLDQLPKKVVRQGRHFSIDYQPVLEGDQLQRVVVVLSDVTAEVERQRSEEDQKEFAALVDRLVRDRAGFLEFWNELGRLIDAILDPARTTSVLRDLHTVKGNSRFYGMWRLSTLCHNLEERLEERKETCLSDEDRADLKAEWGQIRERVDVLTRGASSFLELSEGDYSRLSGGLRNRMSHEILAQVVSEFRYEPTRRRLERGREIIENVCRRTGKPNAFVIVDDHGLRLPPGRWAGFWASFTHVLTNAVEHGLESASQREAAGKNTTGTITLRTLVERDKFIVELSDDGGGVDWEKVRAKAKALGAPHGTQSDLEEALFFEGLSTRDTVTDVAGRGVGLSAVRQAVRELKGSIELKSERGRGTTWRFAFSADLTKEPPRASLLPRSDL